MLSLSPCMKIRLLQNPLRAVLYTSSAPTSPISSSSPTPSRHNQSHHPRSYSTTPPPPKVIFSGIQPTGIPHIGNYLGALQNWKRLQDEAKGTSTKLLFSVVDLHAITLPQKKDDLRRWRKEAMASLLACGLGDGSTLFFQSQVQAHSELMWILSCTASMGYLSRMTQWKSKLQLDSTISPLDESSKAKLKLGLFSYPVLQAADILVHRATHVPVGADQTQHLEFARECVTNFNHTYSPSKPILAHPETLISPAKRIMSLSDPSVKMSKSHPNPDSRILITDLPSTIKRKLAKAVTDSINSVSYDPINRPGVANLLELMSHFDAEERSPEVLEETCKGMGLGSFKELVARTISDRLEGVRVDFERIMRDKGYVEDVAEKGARIARENAEETMVLVREAIGL